MRKLAYWLHNSLGDYALTHERFGHQALAMQAFVRRTFDLNWWGEDFDMENMS